MSEFSATNEQALPKIETYIEERNKWLADAVELITGEREANPLDVFPVPTDPRDDAVAEDRFMSHEAELREIAGRFGIGGEQDVAGEAPVRILEGGKPWKIEAESKIAVPNASIVIFAASPFRKIGTDELGYMREIHEPELGEDASEYDVARILAGKIDGFEPFEAEQSLPFGYEVAEGNAFVEEDNGQLVQIGTVHDKPVIMLRVDQENYQDEGKTKFRHRPDGARLMRFVSEVLRATGDDSSGVGMDTSNTYASRAIDTVIAGFKDGRFYDVGMYGRATLRGLVENTRGFADGIIKIPPGTPMNQLPGELYVIAEKLAQLEAAIKPASE